MLDSDDLLSRDYLHRAAELIEEDANVVGRCRLTLSNPR
jgi:hypothetical protein